MTPEELEERQERLAAAVLEVGRIVGEIGHHAGYSPAKKLEANLLAILDGKEIEAPPSAADESDEENGDGEA